MNSYLFYKRSNYNINPVNMPIFLITDKHTKVYSQGPSFWLCQKGIVRRYRLHGPPIIVTTEQKVCNSLRVIWSDSKRFGYLNAAMMSEVRSISQ